MFSQKHHLPKGRRSRQKLGGRPGNLGIRHPTIRLTPFFKTREKHINISSGNIKNSYELPPPPKKKKKNALDYQGLSFRRSLQHASAELLLKAGSPPWWAPRAAEAAQKIFEQKQVLQTLGIQIPKLRS